MTERTKELIQLAIETVKLNGGTVVVEDESENKEYCIFLRHGDEVKITVK